uniref:Uncharacterized protein n=1 Tax=Mola mola TaxID=94237 RepID=A0A3Q3X638_MOLML
MEENTPSNPRELTQNPLKKIWMPCKNGLPEKHISQRKGAYDNVAAFEKGLALGMSISLLRCAKSSTSCW